MTYSLYIDGKKAVEVAKKFQNGFCYREIRTHKKVIAQVEVVLSTDFGDNQDLVSIGYIEAKNINKVLDALKKIGFSGMIASLEEEHEEGLCYTELVEVCAIRI